MKELISRLIAQFADNNLPQAILFSGDDEKVLMEAAKTLASEILETKNLDSHPDFIFIESPKLEDVARQLSILSLRSFGRRAVILNNAQDLSGAAVSSLLKKIEEPSRGTYYIVLSTHEEKILPTLRSRLTSFRLMPGISPGSSAAKRFLVSNNLAERLEIVSNMQSAIADFIKTLCSSEMRSWGERARIRLPLLLKTFELLAANVQPSRALANLAIRW